MEFELQFARNEFAKPACRFFLIKTNTHQEIQITIRLKNHMSTFSHSLPSSLWNQVYSLLMCNDCHFLMTFTRGGPSFPFPSFPFPSSFPSFHYFCSRWTFALTFLDPFLDSFLDSFSFMPWKLFWLFPRNVTFLLSLLQHILLLSLLLFRFLLFFFIVNT